MAAATFLAKKEGIEGSLFALLMSVFNLGQILCAFIGGRLFDIIGLTPLILISALAGLPGFFFLRRIKTID
jgi:predicted MFS family arabinose efflux permease